MHALQLVQWRQSPVTAQTNSRLWPHKRTVACGRTNKQSPVAAQTNSCLWPHKRTVACGRTKRHSPVTAHTNSRLWPYKRTVACGRTNQSIICVLVFFPNSIILFLRTKEYKVNSVITYATQRYKIRNQMSPYIGP